MKPYGSPMASEQCVNKWRDSRALRQTEHCPKSHQEDYNRQQPQLLPLPHERPQLYDKFTHRPPPWDECEGVMIEQQQGMLTRWLSR